MGYEMAGPQTPGNQFSSETENLVVSVQTHINSAPAWFELMTHDEGVVPNFYAPLFNWKLQSWPRAYGDYFVCTHDNQAVAGADKPMGPHTGVPPGWLVYFSTDDIDAMQRAITDAGGSIVVWTTQIPGAGRYLMARDPLGAIFGGWQPEGHIGAGAVEEPGAPSWTELHVPEGTVGTATEFYSKVMGYRTTSTSQLGTTFSAAETVVAGVRPSVEGADGPLWVPFFGVDDLPNTREAVSRLGGNVYSEYRTPKGPALLLSDAAIHTVGVVAL